MSEWEVKRLDEVVDRVAVKNLAGHNRVLTVAAGRGLVDQETYFNKRVASADLSGYWVVEPGDFVYNKSTSKDAPWGVVARWDGDEPAVVTTLYIVFRPRPGIESDYLLHACNGSFFFDSLRGTLREGARAHGLLNVRLQEFFGAQLVVPSPSEQRRIVDVMAAVDAQITALNAEKEAANSLLALMRNSYPEGSERALSSVVVGIDSGKSVQTSDERPLPGEPAVLKLSAIQLGSFVASEAKRLDDLTGYTEAHAVTDGDLLITRASGSFDRVGYATIASDVPPRTYMSDLIWRIRTKPDVCETTFLAHLLCSPTVRSMITASARGTASMRKINKALLGSLRMPFPPLEEQSEYVERCDAVAFAAKHLDQELSGLRSFRSSLLTSLLNQGIEIPESYDQLLKKVS